MPESVLPVFSSRNCLVSDLTFKYLIHFKLIFVYSMRKYSNIFVLHLVYFSQRHLLKRMPFVCSYLLLCRLFGRRCVGFFWALFCSNGLCICPCASAVLFSISVTQLYIQSEGMIPPALFIFFKIALAVWSLLKLSINFRIFCLVLWKMSYEYFDRHYIKSVDHFRQYGHFSRIDPSSL